MSLRPALAVFSLLCVFAFCGTTSQAQIPIKARINYVVASQDIACPAGAPPAPTTSAFQALSDQLVDLKTKLTELQSNLRDLPGVTPETQQQVTAWLAAINSANPATPTTICAAASHLATVMSTHSTGTPSRAIVSDVTAAPASLHSVAPEIIHPGGGVSSEAARPAPVAANEHNDPSTAVTAAPAISGAADVNIRLPTIATATADAASGAAPSVAACPAELVTQSYAAPSIDEINLAASPQTISGKVQKGTSGTIQVCVDSKLVTTSREDVKPDGSFSLELDSKIEPTQIIQLQIVIPTGTGQDYGLASEKLPADACSKAAPRIAVAAPMLNLSTDAANDTTFSGSVDDKTAGDQVRVCVNDKPVATPAPIKSGKFTSGSSSFPFNATDQVTAQVVRGNGAGFGPPSAPFSKSANAGTKPPTSIIVAGVEYSGYSSQSQTTDGFFEMFYQPPAVHGWTGWARIRLTSAPQPATNGVVSVISNPTGLTTYNYSNVGQVLDFLVGPSWALPHTKHWAAIAAFGATTPLSSQSAPVTFVAPAPGTLECATLLNRFSPKNGYYPGLTPNTSATPTTCIANGITDIAFSDQDRTNFYWKYGGGLRTWYPIGGCGSSDTNCVPTYAAADFTIGQDSAVTGGQLRRLVFKIDGLLPIKMGNSSWLYLFGSAYLRFRANNNLNPLLLASPSSPISVPSPTVDVLPLVQPNRDYYRLGVGLNINQIWCKAFNSTCPNAPASSTDATKPTIATLSPANQQHGSAFTLKVTGTNFVSASKILWKGASLNTTYVSATELHADISVDLAKAGTVQVSVSNSADSTSATKPFTIK